MEFVEDHCPDARKLGVGLDHAGQDTFGHDLDPGGFRGLGIAAHPVADGLAGVFAQGRGHAVGGGAGGQAARLEHDDLLRGEACVEHGQRHAGGLAGARRGLQHRAPLGAQGGDQVGQDVVDGQGVACHAGVMGDRRAQGQMGRACGASPGTGAWGRCPGRALGVSPGTGALARRAERAL